MCQPLVLRANAANGRSKPAVHRRWARTTVRRTNKNTGSRERLPVFFEMQKS